MNEFRKRYDLKKDYRTYSECFRFSLQKFWKISRSK